MNEIERIKKNVIEFQDLIIAAATGTTIDPRTYQRVRNDLLSEPLIRTCIPEFIITSRDLARFWSFISSDMKTYQERRKFIWSSIDPILSYLENESFEPAGIEMQEILDGLNLPVVSDIWKKTLERKKTDPEGAVTTAKSLIESVCKHILDSHKIKYTDKDDIQSLYKKTAGALDINANPKANQVLLKIFSGCSSIIMGVSELRNKFGDAHGKGSSHGKLDESYAGFAIGLAGSMTIFLIKTHLNNKKVKRDVA